MEWEGLRLQISLGSLLIFNDQTSLSAAARSSRCISEDQLNNRTDKYRKTYWDQLIISKIKVPLQDTSTCQQTAKEIRQEVNMRSLSPWKYSLDRDDDRFPREIAVAKCLCEGCIINQKEDMSYNSKEVFAQVMVMKKAQCKEDPKKYVVNKEFIKIPVACTCVVPSYTKSTF
ncbi:interleukin-17C-like protein [Lates japonicus]|uniref:Interleukin-17C-like protein n=1 Tax=Lates japonicus TaxID=270547 RepID=A0AAD3R4P3_LATJO|nr:interleukin-17C-like protein [Lates japonicus]